MEDSQLRLEALRLAHHPDKQVRQLLEDAKKIYEFLKGNE